MRYFYQQMIAFVLVIVVIISTMGLTLFNFSKNQVYLRQQEELSQIADFIVGQEITKDYLQQIQPVLDSASVRVFYFDAGNQRQYPDAQADIQENLQLSESELKQLTSGQQLGLKAFDMGFSERDSDALAIFIPLMTTPSKQYAGYLAIGAPAYLTDRTIRALYVNLLRGVLISGGISVVISALLARYQNRRISRLSQATRQIASGDYTVDIPANNGDEFDDLAKDFNQMTHALQVSQQEVNRQENMRRQLMLDVAHEMRTPLTTMIGLLKGMEDGVLPPEKWERSISLVNSEAQRLARLVNENLDYEKIRANEISLNKVNFSIAPVFNDIALQMNEEAAKKAIQIQIECEPDVRVYADADRFRQIVVNIVKNAVQFTTEGTITIKGTSRLDSTQIIIKDSGVGMTKEEVENIWERFYKADISRKNNVFGESGLGLSIVKQLMNAHEGHISVTSAPGQGTSFTLEFPHEKTLKQEKK
ncbi:sensor histidine kinase [Aerococcus kribbianus]|uniref:histidine kinase n=1 Tax=Aerococcus kribbianus TaxID=2999064 RepID=A0A9X3FN39_9LACT|nr:MULTISPECIES: HAMP domain-containing sensor histidine kinase [unclassified Aerococcus]MCZ0717475.1 HAMP domain-containing sensor histidine kinase [Aerococcus sp. YH-aer221]MCZ0725763.1 HAMP domain-containing sensor histidine kinase [Aerococcus sp. YH-aer222]